MIPQYTRVRYQKEAYNTWQNFYFPPDAAAEVRNYINGTLTCFCDDEYQSKGLGAAFYSYRYDGIDQQPDSIKQDMIENEPEAGEENQICKNYVIF